MIVFNLSNIVNQSKGIYEPYRSKVIKQASGQSSDESKWKKRTERFESTFSPKKGDGEPSEWWIPMYV